MIKKNYLVIPLISILIAAVGGYLSHAGMVWYDTALALPWFVPPKWVFSTVWPILYLMATVAALVLWNQPVSSVVVRYLQAMICLIAFLQIAWCYTFFYKHNIAGGLYLTVALVVCTWSVVVVSYEASLALVSALLVPQALWLSFALCMNAVIWMIN